MNTPEEFQAAVEQALREGRRLVVSMHPDTLKDPDAEQLVALAQELGLDVRISPLVEPGVLVCMRQGLFPHGMVPTFVRVS